MCVCIFLCGTCVTHQHLAVTAAEAFFHQTYSVIMRLSWERLQSQTSKFSPSPLPRKATVWEQKMEHISEYKWGGGL